MNRTGDDDLAPTIDLDPPFIVRDVKRDCRGDEKEAQNAQNSSKPHTKGRHVRPTSTISALYSARRTAIADWETRNAALYI